MPINPVAPLVQNPPPRGDLTRRFPVGLLPTASKTAAAIAKTGTRSSSAMNCIAACPLARDFERYARSAAAFIRLAMIRIMLRRLTNPTLCS